MKITVLYDNNARDGLMSGWGFSCLIEDGQKVLFDCGDKGAPLLHNMEKLGVDPASIDIIALSHDHWDHTGGLKEVLKRTGSVKVIVPASFSEETKGIIRDNAEMVEVEGPRMISENVYTTGELQSKGLPNEQSLAVRTNKGLIVITGCAHPGLSEIISKAREMGRIYMIMGGFHGFSDFSALDGIDVVSPCHCTKHTDDIRKACKDRFREIKAGSVIEA